MCGAVRYSVDGEERVVWAGNVGTELPVLRRGGGVDLVPWGSCADGLLGSPDSPGYFLRLKQGYWVDLSTVQAGEWWQYRPKPVRISAIAFGFYDGEFDRWVELKPGEFIQGALLELYSRRVVYVVTVLPPAKYANAKPAWPRIVRTPARVV